MDLKDALGDWPGSNQNQNQGGGGAWPGQQPPNPVWPGAPAPTAPGWPSAPGQPPSSWPSGPTPSQPAPCWPGGPSPSQPAPCWPGGQPGGPAQPVPSWPSPAPSHPAGPGGWPSPAPGPSPSPGFPAAPQQNLTIPYKQSFPHGLQDRHITIRGTVKPHPNMFTIDLCTANDIAFHFNPRFNEGGRRVVVRNSQIHNKWGKEERDGSFSFAPGQNFEIKISVTHSGFKVQVNGSQMPEFRHRAGSPRDIRSMSIYNDITLSGVNVQ